VSERIPLFTGPVRVRIQNPDGPDEILEIDIRDPLAWRRDHPEAFEQVLAETDERIAEVVNGWGMNPPKATSAEPVVIEVPEDAPRRRTKRLAPAEDRLTVTVEEAAKKLGISRAFAYEAVNSGDIPTIRIGRRILVPKAALHRLLAGEQPRPKQDPA
jgi:excisionase family DNA binding protein